MAGVDVDVGSATVSLVTVGIVLVLVAEWVCAAVELQAASIPGTSTRIATVTPVSPNP
jgi:hypothetical protein